MRHGRSSRAHTSSETWTTSVLPPWFYGFGGHFALLCAALAGIVPFLGIAIFVCIGPGEDSASAASMKHLLTLPQGGGAEGVDNSVGSHLATVLHGLQQTLRQQEIARQASDATITERMRRLEDTLVAHVAAVSTAALPAGPARAVPQFLLPVSPDGGDQIAGLGIDWAAWGAGAEIDHGSTSWGLGRKPSASGLMGRAARLVAAVLPRYRAYAGNVSHPAEVVLAADSAPPSKCFSFWGNGTVAIRLLQPRRASHVVLEQMPAWATLLPQAAPRHFQVKAWEEGEAEPYRTTLGSFEYALAGPRAQAFALSAASRRARGFQFSFQGSWGAEHTSVCRLRVLGPAGEAAA